MRENLRREEKYIRHFLFGLNCSFIYIHLSTFNSYRECNELNKSNLCTYEVTKEIISGDFFLIRKKNLFAESIKI